MIPKHLDDCVCGDQRMHHEGNDGHCMKRDCPCDGFIQVK